jgi:hypothetical protein
VVGKEWQGGEACRNQVGCFSDSSRARASSSSMINTFAYRALDRYAYPVANLVIICGTQVIASCIRRNSPLLRLGLALVFGLTLLPT